MDQRKAGVGPCHVRTLEWALESHAGLLDWPKYGQGVYWVSGKPGSGKSTLMKFLYNDNRTRGHLEHWAGPSSSLGIGSFFLWNLGAEEQKSQEGLAKALLYQFLESNRPLIPIILPNMWRECDKLTSSSAMSIPPLLPSKEDLREAFELLQSHYDDGAKYCLFLDGLDELSGDHGEAIELVQKLSTIKNIKVIVSSRPIALCEDAFSAGPHLRLQDLTRGDIRLYVQDHIASHPQMVALMEENSDEAASVVQELADRASGVFLWVVLACKSVREGLAKSDTIKDLRSRVAELPPELEGLFTHILSRIEPRYQQEAARFLKIAHAQLSCPYEGFSCNFGLSLADMIATSQQKIPELVGLSATQRIYACKAIDGRLRSRCWGLLETNTREGELHCLAGQGPNSPHEEVVFMHRTVFDFLSDAKIWELPCPNLNDQHFDPKRGASVDGTKSPLSPYGGWVVIG